MEAKMDEAKAALLKSGEEAEEFMSDGLSKIRNKMAPSGKTYPHPNIPETPSKAINNMLQTKCDKSFESPVKYYLATFICFVFSAIVKVYKMIYKDGSKPSNTMWMAACGIICVAHIVACFLLYYIAIGCSFLLHHLLYYGCVLLCLFGVGLTVSGVVFFDKGSNKQSPGFESSGKSE